MNLLNLKKIILMVMCIFLLSGCDVAYDLKINKDLTVTEEVVALEDKYFNDLAHDYLLDRISVAFSSRYDELYEYSAISEDTRIGNKVARNYNSLNEYKEQSNVFLDLIDNYTITETADTVNFNIIVSDDIYDTNDMAYTIIPENMTINIELPYKIINTNSDTKTGNIYSWKIDKDHRSANIMLSFEKNRLSDTLYILNIGISYGILIAVGIILTASVIVLVISKKIRGINKI
ncbi:MAG: hypothetical protein PHT75_04765 [Bacilli bacterium]|nr:hypothetical protein [Bacilli bacterium]MDD4053340.1 hypothetical protein [Bacilli bacterium]MDD4411013.1 hypothetical protein [Bacilli bacterium]